MPVSEVDLAAKIVSSEVKEVASMTTVTDSNKDVLVEKVNPTKEVTETSPKKVAVVSESKNEEVSTVQVSAGKGKYWPKH